MGAAAEEAKKMLYEKVIKKIAFEDLVRHRKFQHKSLVEMLSKFPGSGVGFKVSHVNWPEGTFYHVRKVNLFSQRYGRMQGIKYVNNEIANHKYEKIPEILKRGLWRYQVNDPKFTEPLVTLDNGMEFDVTYLEKKWQEKQQFLQLRKERMVPVKGEDEDEGKNKKKK